MKQTPITKSIEQIRIQAEDYRKRGNGDKSEALLDTINLLQSLLPYERECFEETYNNGAMCDMHPRENKDGSITMVHLSAQDYFTNTYESI